MTSQAVRLSRMLVISAALYLLADVFLISDPVIKHQIWPLLPWWALISFGSYLLAKLGFGILTFEEKEQDYKNLMKVCKMTNLCQDTLILYILHGRCFAF